MGFCFYSFRNRVVLEHHNSIFNIIQPMLKSLQLCTTFFGAVRQRGYSIVLSRVVDFLESLSGQKVFFLFNMIGILLMDKREYILCKVTLRKRKLQYLLEYFFYSVVFKLYERLYWWLKSLSVSSSNLALYLKEQVMFSGVSKEVFKGISLVFEFDEVKLYIQRFLSMFGFVV